MPDYIFTSKEEIAEIVRQAVSDIFQIKQAQKPVFDTVNIDSAIEFLAENGCKTTKSQIYRFTSQKQMPFMKFGNKLLFSKKELFEWIKSSTRRSSHRDDALMTIKNGMRKT